MLLTLLLLEAMIIREETKGFASCSCCCRSASPIAIEKNPINGETAFCCLLHLKPYFLCTRKERERERVGYEGEKMELNARKLQNDKASFSFIYL